MNEIIRSSDDIDALVNWCEEQDYTHYPGMTYEEGIMATLVWITGDTEENPGPEDA